MSYFAVDPVHWSIKTILAQDSDVIEELAKRSAGTTTAYRVVLGRCLLAMDESKLCTTMGFSSSIHYAIQVLGLEKKEAYGLRRVALNLESLPLLTEAAERGQISWTKLRSVTTKASLETEDFWLRICARKNSHEVERLCAASEYGKLPWEEGGEPDLPVTRLQLHLDAARGELFERLALSVSEKAGRTLSVVEAIEHLAVELLSNRPATPRRVQNMRKDAERGANAKRRSHSHLIQDARELAEGWGLVNEADALAMALGTDRVEYSQGEDGITAEPRASSASSAQAGSHPAEDLDVAGPTDNEVGGARMDVIGTAGHRVDGARTVVAEPPDKDVDGARTGALGSTGHQVDGAGGVMAASDDNDTGAAALCSGAEGSDNVPARGQLGDCATSRRRAMMTGFRPTSVPARGQCQPSPPAPVVEALGPGPSTAGQERDESPSSGAEKAVKPPCADHEVEAVEIGSARFEELVALGHFDEKYDWQNPRLTFNPRARKATVAQRKEILRRDGYCCRTPGCPHRMWLQLHHTVYFSRCGETVRKNLVPLCFRCHTNVHNGLLKITGNADGSLTFTDASGNDLERTRALGIADWLNFWVGWRGGQQDRHQPRALGFG